MQATSRGRFTHSAYWLQQHQAVRNWLALGLLLAAWNAADDAAGKAAKRPLALRPYQYVSVRAASRLDASSERSSGDRF